MKISQSDIGHPKDIFKSIKCSLHSILKDPDLIQPKLNQVVLDLNQYLIFGYQFIRSFLLDRYHRHKSLPIVDKNFVLESLKTIGTTDVKRPLKTKHITTVEFVIRHAEKINSKEKLKIRQGKLNNINSLINKLIDRYSVRKQTDTCKLKRLSKKFRFDLLKKLSRRIPLKYYFSKRAILFKRFRTSYDFKFSLRDQLTRYFNSHFKYFITSIPNYSNKLYILVPLALQIVTCITTNLSTHFLDYLHKYVNIVFKYPGEVEIKKIKYKKDRKSLYNKLNADLKSLKSALFNDDINLADPKYHDWFKANRPLLFPSTITNNLAYDIKAHTQKYFKYSFYINEQIEKLGRRPYQVIPQRNNLIPQFIPIDTAALIAVLDDKGREIYDYGKTEMSGNIKKYQDHAWDKILKLDRKDIFKHKNYSFFHQISTDGVSCSILFIHEKFKNKKWGQHLPKHEEKEIIVHELNKLSKEQCDEYLSDRYKLIGLDPGKRSIITLSDGTKNLSYSAYQRRYETYAKRSAEIISKEKIKHNIIEKETMLSNYNSRTLDKNEYTKFIENKNILNEQLKSFYHRSLFRKLAFRRYCRTRQSEDDLINNIERTFLAKEEIKSGKKLIIGYGNWSRKTQMKRFMSTPNKKIKTLMNERFKILSVEECMTSQLYNKNFKQLKKVYVKRKSGKHYKAVYGLLTPQEKTEKHIIVNRDKNAAKNMLYVLEYYLRRQERPEEFKKKNSRETRVEGLATESGTT